MAIVLNAIIFITGLVLLILSSHVLINACVKISRLLKLTPLFIGIILVAFGTSAPELAVGITAALKNYKAIAVGNIIGSNIANIGLILGLCACLRPLAVAKSLFKRELPLMGFSVLLFYIYSLDLVISRIEGVSFILCFIAFCILSYRGAHQVSETEEMRDFTPNKFLKQTQSRFMVFGITMISLAGLLYGAHLMVKSGVALARLWGLSPWIIAITIFAIGTSLPELAASLSAIFKKLPSISLGNIVGSNIFNVWLVLGVVSLIRPLQLAPSALVFELPALLVFSIFLFIAMRTKYIISRLEGLVLFLGYFVFIFLLFWGQGRW